MTLHFQLTKNNGLNTLELLLVRQLLIPVVALAGLILSLSSLLDTNTPALANSPVSNDYSSEALLVLHKKIAALEEESQRLKSFTEKIITLADLDKAVFSLNQPLARGGNHDVDEKGNDARPAILLSKDVKALKFAMLQSSHQLERMQLMLKSRDMLHAESQWQWPIQKGYISSGYGMRKDPFNGRQRQHHGIDIAAPKGTPVMSVAQGVVRYSGRKRGYGRIVEIQHPSFVISRYAHLSKVLVTNGQAVGQGDMIGHVGSSGRSTGPHLHLEILKRQKRINPIELFGQYKSRQ